MNISKCMYHNKHIMYEASIHNPYHVRENQKLNKGQLSREL